MDRRRFLLGGVLGAAGVALPLWLRRAFSPGEALVDSYELSSGRHPCFPPRPKDPPPGPSRIVELGVRHAKEKGKPLLVLLIPEEKTSREERGHLWGRLLSYGEGRGFLALALYEVVCAPAIELVGLAPVLTEQAPLALLLDTDRYSPHLSALLNTRLEGDDSIEQQIKQMEEMLDEGILPNRHQRERYLEQAKKTLSWEQVKRIEAGLLAQSLSVEDADRGAAIVYEETFSRKRWRARYAQAMLQKAIEARLQKQRIPGSAWGEYGACSGPTIDGEGSEERGFYSCGMARIPEKGKRFLSFFIENGDV